MPSITDRRRLLLSAAGLLTVSTAGCLGSDDTVETSEDGSIELYDHRIAEGQMGLTPVVSVANAGTDPVATVTARVTFFQNGAEDSAVEEDLEAPEPGDVIEENIRAFSMDRDLDETDEYTVELFVEQELVDDGHGQMPQ